MGCSVHVNGRRSFGDWDGSSAIVRINEDGRATIITGEGEIGQGTLTVLRQIAAEELGLPYEDVDITRPDTDVQPHSLGALASRVTYVAGNAVKNAPRRRRKQLMEAAAEQFKRPARAHDHQRRDRAAQRPRKRIQAGRRGGARATSTSPVASRSSASATSTTRPSFPTTAATATNRAPTTSPRRRPKSRSTATRAK